VKRAALPLSLAGLLLGTAQAQAHLVTTGLGPFYDGISHVLLSPDELLGVMGLALLAGQNGVRCSRLLLGTLPVAWMLGGLLGLYQSAAVSLPAVSSLALVVIGTLVARDRRVRAAVLISLAGTFGALHGYGNGTVAAQSPLGMTGLLGISATIFVLVALLAAFTVSLRPLWTQVAVRVAGSWIAAIGLLLTGWVLRQGA
jgi:hydrogenase/urease accessory protein HupE